MPTIPTIIGMIVVKRDAERLLMCNAISGDPLHSHILQIKNEKKYLLVCFSIKSQSIKTENLKMNSKGNFLLNKCRKNFEEMSKYETLILLAKESVRISKNALSVKILSLIAPLILNSLRVLSLQIALVSNHLID